MRIAILDDYQGVALSHADWSGLEQTCQITVFRRPLALAEAADLLQPFDVVCHMRERMAFPAALIDRLSNLKLIIITGGTHRGLDVAAATRRGVVVCNTTQRPDIGKAAPELAWGLLLSVARDIPQADGAVRGGGWQTTVGMGLHGKTLGLLGLGRIGRQMAVYARAFGMRTLAWSPNLTAEAAQEGGAEWVSKAELFARSDAISVHLVLGERSRGLVGPPELAAMKPGAILINTSRGPIVQEEALLAALERGAIRAGLDVYDQEPLPAGHPLRSAPHTVLTPHLGFVTHETYRAFYEDTVADIEAYLAGAPIRVVA